MITAKINCSRIDKKYLFKGKNGMYLDLVIFANKNGPDQYGNTHTILQSIPKEARERGEKGPIIGNLKLDEAPPARKPAPKPIAPPAEPPPEGDDVPF